MRSVRDFLQLDPAAPTGRGVRIAVVDSGIDDTHPDLEGAVSVGESRHCVPPYDDLQDTHHHGTHVAGIIAGRGRLHDGTYRGIAPESTLISYKTIPSNGGLFSVHALGGALASARERNVDLVVLAQVMRPLSPRTKDPNRPLAQVSPPWRWAAEQHLDGPISEAAKAGILTIVPVGNHGSELATVLAPAGHPSVLSVGASTLETTVHESSSRGPYLIDTQLKRNDFRTWNKDYNPYRYRPIPRPDVVVPGVQIFAPHASTCIRSDPHNLSPCKQYLCDTGTSQATAVVAGLAALAIEMLRDAGLWQGVGREKTLRELLCNSAEAASEHQYAAGRGVLRWPALKARVRAYIESTLV
jgi:subtilisin family serine protease